MALLATQTVTRAGIAMGTTAAAGGGDTFAPARTAHFYIFNGGGSPITVTFVTPGSLISDVPISDVAVSVTNGTERYFGPFASEFFSDPTDGLVHVTYSGVTSVTVGAFHLTQP